MNREKSLINGRTTCSSHSNIVNNDGSVRNSETKLCRIPDGDKEGGYRKTRVSP